MKDDSFEEYEVGDELDKIPPINITSRVIPHLSQMPLSVKTNDPHVYVRKQYDSPNNSQMGHKGVKSSIAFSHVK